MSNSDDPSRMIWVSDLDGYVDLDEIQYWNDREGEEEAGQAAEEEAIQRHLEEFDNLDNYISLVERRRLNEKRAEEEALQQELDAIGDIPLLAGKMTSASKLNAHGTSPANWRHAVHLATTSIGKHSYSRADESAFIRSMIDLGRPYSVARYARWEELDYPSAVTASLMPHGIRALVNQFMAVERLERTPEIERRIREALSAGKTEGATAYDRTGKMQVVLYEAASLTHGTVGGAALSTAGTRRILSLLRLYFSVCELRLDSMSELRQLSANYARRRQDARSDVARINVLGRTIPSWRLRHVRPLTDLYPYSIRHGLARAVAHEAAFDHDKLVNELALAHCGVRLMRAKRRDRDQDR